MQQSRGSGLRTRSVLGVEVVVATAAEVSDHLLRGITTGTQQQVAFLNAHTSNLAARDREYAQVLSTFTVLNDGVGVDLASRWGHGEPFPENLNGTDFVPAFLARATEPLRIYLVGARPGVAQAAGAAVQQSAPQHRVVGCRDGYFAAAEEDAVVAEIKEAAPDVLLVALGNPIQERFIVRHGAELAVPLAFGVGALFDFLAGRVERAPGWVRAVRAEWAWRLAKEPGRLWRRYVVGNAYFLLRTWRSPRHR